MASLIGPSAAAAKLLSKDEAPRIASNIAKLRSCCANLEPYASRIAPLEKSGRFGHNAPQI
jgi:hypothetical protein